MSDEAVRVARFLYLLLRPVLAALALPVLLPLLLAACIVLSFVVFVIESWQEAR